MRIYLPSLKLIAFKTDIFEILTPPPPQKNKNKKKQKKKTNKKQAGQVSCNLSDFCRDCKKLNGKGYFFGAVAGVKFPS